MSKCKVCRSEFVKRSMTHKCCTPACAEQWVAKENARKAAKRARAERMATTKAILNLEPIGYFEKKAEKAVNEYVRYRDFHLGCCSCDKPATWDGKWNASHLRSVGAASAVRFHLWNIAKACVQCNLNESGNLGEYLPRAIARLGQDRVDWLYAQNKPARRSREYLERLAAVMRKKTRRIKKRLGIA